MKTIDETEMQKAITKQKQKKKKKEKGVRGTEATMKG